MIHDATNWRIKTRRGALALIAAILPLASFASSAAHAQSIMRSPNLNIQSRMPSINPNLGGRAVTGIGGLIPRIRPACSPAYRGSSGD